MNIEKNSEMNSNNTKASNISPEVDLIDLSTYCTDEVCCFISNHELDNSKKYYCVPSEPSIVSDNINSIVKYFTEKGELDKYMSDIELLELRDKIPTKQFRNHLVRIRVFYFPDFPNLEENTKNTSEFIENAPTIFKEIFDSDFFKILDIFEENKISEFIENTKTNISLNLNEQKNLFDKSIKKKILIELEKLANFFIFDKNTMNKDNADVNALQQWNEEHAMTKSRSKSKTPKKGKKSPKRKASPKRSTSPKRKASPAKRKASPKRSSSPKRKASPAKRKASPKRSVSPKRKASPVKRKASPKRKDSPKRSSSPKRKASPKKVSSRKTPSRSVKRSLTNSVRRSVKKAGKRSVKKNNNKSGKSSVRRSTKRSVSPKRRVLRKTASASPKAVVQMMNELVSPKKIAKRKKAASKASPKRTPSRSLKRSPKKKAVRRSRSVSPQKKL